MLNSYYSLGACSPVQLVNVLCDDGHGASLLRQALLRRGDGGVRRVGDLVSHHFPSVVVELPYQARVSVKGFWRGELLGLQYMS